MHSKSKPEKYQLLDPLRSDEYAALETDIRKRGVLIPVEKDKDGEILDGHHRQEIAEALGVPCPEIVRDFASEQEKREHVIKINLARRHFDPIRWGKAFALLLEERRRGFVENTATVAENHTTNGRNAETVEALAEELGVPKRTAERRLSEYRKYDALPPEEKEAVDAGEKTVHKAAREAERRAKLEEKAAVAPESVSPSWEIRQGDCSGELRFWTAGPVNLIFADPPYNIGIDYGDGAKADKLPDAEFIHWCREWIGQCVEVLAGDGSFWLLINDEYADALGCELRRAGLHRRGWVKWYETFGVNCANNFNRCSRHLFYCVKDKKHFTFNAAPVSRPSDRQTKYDDPRANPDGKILDDVWEIPRLTGTCAERLPDFPTQLPLEMLRRVVECSSNPGDLVLDPFSGSGTTGVAAIQSGRKYLGIEKSERFVKLATLRLKGVSPCEI